MGYLNPLSFYYLGVTMPEEDEEDEKEECFNEAMGVDKQEYDKAWMEVIEHFKDEGEVGIDIPKSELVRYIQENYSGDLKDMLIFNCGQVWTRNVMVEEAKHRCSRIIDMLFH